MCNCVYPHWTPFLSCLCCWRVWGTGSWSARWSSCVYWTCDANTKLLPSIVFASVSPTWWTILHLDYFRDLSQESAVIITNKAATWAVLVLILLISWSFQDSIPLGRVLGYTSQQGKKENEWKGTSPGLHHNHPLCIYTPAMMPGMKLGNRSRLRQPLRPSIEWEITVWFSAKRPGLESHH